MKVGALIFAGMLALIGCSNNVDSGQDIAVPSPLEVEAGVSLYLDAELSLDEQENFWIERENSIRSCMQNRGFEYNPREFLGALDRNVLTDELPEGDWINRYGYGISTTIIEEGALAGTGLIGATVPSRPPTDPNDSILAEMSEIERSEWMVALTGELPAGEPSVDIREEMFDGCVQRTEFGTEEATQFRRANQDLMDDLDRMVRADVDFRQAEDAVSRCLIDNGLDPDNEAERLVIRQDAEDILTTFQDELFDQMLQLEEAGNASVQGSMSELVRTGAIGMSDELTEQLRDLQDFEIASANSFVLCGGSELDAVYDEIRFDMEQSVISRVGQIVGTG